MKELQTEASSTQLHKLSIIPDTTTLDMVCATALEETLKELLQNMLGMHR